MSSASAERRRWVAALGTAAAFCAAAVLAAGCGGSDSPAREAPAAASFPAVEGRSLLDLYGQTERSGLVVLPVGLVYEKGTRYGFAVYTVAKKQVTEADIAIYFSHGEDGPALGPYPARVESLQTRPQFQSQSTGEDPESSQALYVVDRYLRGQDQRRVFNVYRTRLGQGLLLGLEILVAADVVRTVALAPTLANVLILGLLVVIRTFLSWSLVVELEGRWPWQASHRREAEDASTEP